MKCVFCFYILLIDDAVEFYVFVCFCQGILSDVEREGQLFSLGMGFCVDSSFSPWKIIPLSFGFHGLSGEIHCHSNTFSLVHFSLTHIGLLSSSSFPVSSPPFLLLSLFILVFFSSKICFRFFFISCISLLRLFVYLFLICFKHACNYWSMSITAALKLLSDNSNISHLGVAVTWSLFIPFEFILALGMMSDF